MTMFEELCARAFKGKDFVDDIQVRNATPFFHSNTGHDWIGKAGLRLNQWDICQGTHDSKGTTFRKMFAKGTLGHWDLAVAQGQSYAACHSDDITKKVYMDAESLMQKAVNAIAVYQG